MTNRGERRRAVMKRGLLVCAVIISSVLLIGFWKNDTALYSVLARSAGWAGLQDLSQWLGDKRDASWERDLERRVADGTVAKVFLSDPDGSVDQDKLFDSILHFHAKGLKFYSFTGVDRYQYESRASEAPSYVAYVHSDDETQFKESWKALGLQVVLEPPKKDVGKRVLRKSMKEASYVDAPFASVLFDVVQQIPHDPRLAFQIREEALASAAITIHLPAGLDMKETLTRLCRSAKCDYEVSASWDEVDMVVIFLERPGARKRVGVIGNSSWPGRETVVVEESHICRYPCPICGAGVSRRPRVVPQQTRDSE